MVVGGGAAPKRLVEVVFTSVLGSGAAVKGFAGGVVLVKGFAGGGAVAVGVFVHNPLRL